MPLNKSMSILRNRTLGLALLYKEQLEPVYVTTNKEGDLVVMSQKHHEKIQANIEWFEKFAVPQAPAALG